MDLVLQRLEHDDASTVGALAIDGEHAVFICEDQPQAGPKVRGETRIPAGRYRLELKPVGTSRFDATARELLGDGHKGMIRLVDVPGFTEVLYHWGNFHTDTEACLLPGESRGRDKHGNHAVWRSQAAYKRTYPNIADAILCGETWIDVRDEMPA